MAGLVSVRSWACWAISAPWSQVSEGRSCWGRVMIDNAIASRTASVAVAGESGPVVDPLPFAVAWHGWEVQEHREPGGALNKRPDRGTPKSQGSGRLPSVLALPRSSASAGRWLIMISGLTKVRRRCRVRARGTRNARPVRRHDTSSRFSAPRPCTQERLVDGGPARKRGLGGVKSLVWG